MSAVAKGDKTHSEKRGGMGEGLSVCARADKTAGGALPKEEKRSEKEKKKKWSPE